MDFTMNLEKGLERFTKKGGFLTVKSGDIVNTMTISWGSVGFVWNKPVFMVVVRESRYTKELIDSSEDFTVSIPLTAELDKALAICGSKCGRDVDKEKEANMNFISSKGVSSPIVEGCNLYYECKIVFKQKIDETNLQEEIGKSCYDGGNYHTLYYGEIINVYEK